MEKANDEANVASENSIYHTSQLFVKMLKVQNCEWYMMHPQGRTAKVLYREAAEIWDGLYVDDLIAGRKNFEQVASLKDKVIQIFNEVGFKLHNLHSNVPALKGIELVNETDKTFTNQQLDVN